MNYSITNTKFNSVFQNQIQLADEELIVNEYYFDLNEIKNYFDFIMEQILDKNSYSIFEDSIVDYHLNSIDRIHNEFENCFYEQFCIFNNIYQYDKILKNLEQFITELEIPELENKSSQISSAISFMDYCLLAQRFENGIFNVNEEILQFITFSKSIFYKIICLIENVLDEKYDEVNCEFEE